MQGHRRSARLWGHPGFFDSPFQLEETIKEIELTKSRGASGPDLLNNFILKLLPNPVLEFLVKCFNLMVADGSFPAL